MNIHIIKYSWKQNNMNKTCKYKTLRYVESKLQITVGIQGESSFPLEVDSESQGSFTIIEYSDTDTDRESIIWSLCNRCDVIWRAVTSSCQDTLDHHTPHRRSTWPDFITQSTFKCLMSRAAVHKHDMEIQCEPTAGFIKHYSSMISVPPSWC